MEPHEPFEITPELRQKAVEALATIIETGTPSEQIEACRVLVEMDRMNLQVSESSGWLGKTSQN